MKRVSLFLPEPQVAALQALAKQLDRPYAELVREAVDELLRKRTLAASRKTERRRSRTGRQRS